MSLETVQYRDIPANSVFKVIRPEMHSRGLVKNHGLYAKVAQSHSVELGSKKDCIFEPKTLCRIVNRHASDFAKGVH